MPVTGTPPPSTSTTTTATGGAISFASDTTMASPSSPSSTSAAAAAAAAAAAVASSKRKRNFAKDTPRAPASIRVVPLSLSHQSTGFISVACHAQQLELEQQHLRQRCASVATRSSAEAALLHENLEDDEAVINAVDLDTSRAPAVVRNAAHLIELSLKMLELRKHHFMFYLLRYVEQARTQARTIIALLTRVAAHQHPLHTLVRRPSAVEGTAAPRVPLPLAQAARRRGARQRARQEAMAAPGRERLRALQEARSPPDQGRDARARRQLDLPARDALVGRSAAAATPELHRCNGSRHGRRCHDLRWLAIATARTRFDTSALGRQATREPHHQAGRWRCRAAPHFAQRRSSVSERTGAHRYDSASTPALQLTGLHLSELANCRCARAAPPTATTTTTASQPQQQQQQHHAARCIAILG